MNDELVFILFAYIIINIAFLIYMYSPIIKRWYKKNKAKKKDDTYYLNIMCNEGTVESKADAFISLLYTGYVLIHTMVNKGNNYDDEKQTKFFCSSLDMDGVIDSLNRLGENYNG